MDRGFGRALDDRAHVKRRSTASRGATIRRAAGIPSRIEKAPGVIEDVVQDPRYLHLGQGQPIRDLNLSALLLGAPPNNPLLAEG
jgi:hypothetical protein